MVQTLNIRIRMESLHSLKAVDFGNEPLSIFLAKYSDVLKENVDRAMLKTNVVIAN